MNCICNVWISLFQIQTLSSTAGGTLDAYSFRQLHCATDCWSAEVSAPGAPLFKSSCHRPTSCPPARDAAARLHRHCRPPVGPRCPRALRPGLAERGAAPRRADPESVLPFSAPVPTADRGPAWARPPRRSWSRVWSRARARPPTRAVAAALAVVASSAAVVVAAAVAVAAVVAGRRRRTPDGHHPCRRVACDVSKMLAGRLSCRRASVPGGHPWYRRRRQKSSRQWRVVRQRCFVFSRRGRRRLHRRLGRRRPWRRLLTPFGWCRRPRRRRRHRRGRLKRWARCRCGRRALPLPRDAGTAVVVTVPPAAGARMVAAGAPGDRGPSGRCRHRRHRCGLWALLDPVCTQLHDWGWARSRRRGRQRPGWGRRRAQGRPSIRPR